MAQSSDILPIAKEETKTTEDVLLEQDIEGNKRQRQRQKGHLRNRDKIDTTQYDDDSSSDDEDPDGPVVDEKNNIEMEEARDDSDSDMFSDDDDDDEDNTQTMEQDQDQSPQRKKRKGPQLLTQTELEQELGIESTRSADPEDVEEDPTSNEPKIEAFNVNKEMTTGRFDVNGNYIKLADDSDDEEEDSKKNDQWYADLKREDITRAKLAKEQIERISKEKNQTKFNITASDLLDSLIRFLEPGETPIEAMQRSNRGKLTGVKLKKATEEQKLKEKTRSEKIMALTEWCEGLLEKGINDVYELEREECMGLYQRETGERWRKNKSDEEEEEEEEEEEKEEEDDDDEIPKDGKATNNDKQEEERKWEFKWDGDETVNGPYTNTEMNYWKDNYFQGKVSTRKIDDDEEDWVSINYVNNFN